jgi:hypothetical protein
MGGAVLPPDKVLQPLVRVFVPSIPIRSPAGDVKTAGPSTAEIIAFAVISSGRDDRIE